MSKQVLNQAETIGVLEEETTFVVQPYPQNLGQAELERAVRQYRQAVQQLAQVSKSVEVNHGC